ncbi:MAG: formate/nitrite transporter family protein [Ruminiclostridium sp.]|nr:formate/nitrite transporter family protein [Ruminiclostridium sp.]
MKKNIDLFLRSVLTGMMIGLGGIVNLSCDNRYIGSFLFATGLFVILTFGFTLFTGKVGYAVENKLSYLIDLLIIWFGNLVGTMFDGFVIQLTRVGGAISEKAAGLCETKLADNLLSIFVLAFFCGMLMFIAADGYKNLTNPVAQMLAVILPVMVFILCGFEHCVANMFYFTAGNMWSAQSFLYLVVMSLGNAAGGITIPLARKAFVK